MNEIWKFPLTTTDEQSIEVPSGSQFLYLDVQHATPCLWMLVDPRPEVPKELRNYRIVGTGHPIDTSYLQYLGSYMLDGGSMVFHVWEKL